MARNNIINDRKDYVLYGILCLIIIATLYFYFSSKSNPVSDTIIRNQDLITAFIINDGENVLLTEVYIYNVKNKRAALFDIPGNIGHVFTDKKILSRIDSLFKESNSMPYIKTISSFLGLEEIPFYFVLNRKTLSNLVDLIGGIEVFLPNNIHYTDVDGNDVSLPSGLVVLDGETLWAYLACPKGEEDSKIYVDRRQKFMQSLLKQISIKNHLMTNFKVKKYLQSIMNSNLEKSSYDMFFKEIALLDTDGLILQKIVGSPRVIDEGRLLFPHYDGKLVRETVKQALESLENSNVIMVDLWPRKIEIQNGTKRNGLANSTQRIYESLGFSVSKVGNAVLTNGLETGQTTVIDLSGKIEVAQKVADVIKCTKVHSVERTDENAIDGAADVLVILGKDFDGRYVKQITGTTNE